MCGQVGGLVGMDGEGALLLLRDGAALFVSPFVARSGESL